MNDSEIYEWCQKQVLSENLLNIPKEILEKITFEQAQIINNYFPKTTLFKLPQYEIDFFEWVKLVDPSVWEDLWTDEINPPYIVSLIFLPVLVKGSYRGFPICDLVNNENYFFAPAHLADKESEIFTESSKTRFLNKESLTVPQLLSIEISMDAIDIWHFAYKHKIELPEAKKAVKALVNDEVLVHLKDAEYLSTFINF
jgi:hypothetical protein